MLRPLAGKGCNRKHDDDPEKVRSYRKMGEQGVDYILTVIGIHPNQNIEAHLSQGIEGHDRAHENLDHHRSRVGFFEAFHYHNTAIESNPFRWKTRDEM